MIYAAGQPPVSPRILLLPSVRRTLRSCSRGKKRPATLSDALILHGEDEAERHPLHTLERPARYSGLVRLCVLALLPVGIWALIYWLTR